MWYTIKWSEGFIMEWWNYIILALVIIFTLALVVGIPTLVFMALVKYLRKKG